MTGSPSGRGPELATVDDTLAKSRASFGLLVIEGEAGIGKTTVLARRASSGLAGRLPRSVLPSGPGGEPHVVCRPGDLLASVDPAELTPLPGSTATGARDRAAAR